MCISLISLQRKELIVQFSLATVTLSVTDKREIRRGYYSMERIDLGRSEKDREEKKIAFH